MNPEIKPTIEQLMEECFALNQSYGGGCSYLLLSIRGNGKYEAHTYGMNPTDDDSAIGALTKLKAELLPRAQKEIAAELARAEKDLASAQAKVATLTATHNTLAINDLASQ